MTSFSLRSVKLRSGEEHREEVEVELEPLEFGGQRYLPIPAKVPAELTIDRASTGMVFRLRFHGHLFGPCYRCLAETSLDVDVDVREYQASNPGGVDELTNPYLADDNLDLSAWARDAVALGLPDKILCRADCAGLCPECGRDLNLEPHEHETDAHDPRWDDLARLRERL